MTKEDILMQYFGYSKFRGGQPEIIDNITNGRDVLAVMPTGAGKSICYQIPALLLDGITLVISPLISLMQDQVRALSESGVPAAYLNSALSPEQMRRVLNNTLAGKYKLLYVAPERLDSEIFNEFSQQIKISLITIDEAHCISQWGQDFRPSYLKICDFLNNQKLRPIVAAFTATATEDVKNDISRILRLNNPYTLTTGFDRKNLYFEVRKPQNKYSELIKLLNQYKDKNGIVYCSTRKTVDELYNRLNKDGYKALCYHAGMHEDARRRSQEDFIYDRTPIMIATNAFGMGIDKSNISFVIHYNMPKDMESYYQEAGRAGRDGSPADCILLYGKKDVLTNRFLIDHGEENENLDPQTLQEVTERSRERLKLITFYCHTQDCLRSYILQYFGEKNIAPCGNCGSCNTYYENTDITEDAQKIMSCIARTGERYGIKIICDTLKGSKTERILKLGLNQIKTYGIMTGESEKKIRDIINHLLLKEYLLQAGSEYPILKLTPKSRPILKGQEHIQMKLIKEPKETEHPSSDSGAVQTELLTRLKALRLKIAKNQSVPAYIIFSDASLTDMCKKLPINENEFLNISGVGEAKLRRYGDDFIKLIREYLKESK